MLRKRWLMLLTILLVVTSSCGDDQEHQEKQTATLERAFRSQVEAERTGRTKAEQELDRERRQRAREQLAAKTRSHAEARQSVLARTLSITLACLLAAVIVLLARERRLRLALMHLLERLLRGKTDER